MLFLIYGNGKIRYEVRIPLFRSARYLYREVGFSCLEINPANQIDNFFNKPDQKKCSLPQISVNLVVYPPNIFH